MMFFMILETMDVYFPPSVFIDPMSIQIAVPLSVGTNSMQLHIQRPQHGLIDGVKVCVCPGVCDPSCEGTCGYKCEWYALPAGVETITVGNLSPGSKLQLSVSSSSRQCTGPPFYTRLIRTGEESGAGKTQ